MLYESLPQAKVLDVLITYRGRSPSHTRRIWDYRLWDGDLKDRAFTRLCSDDMAFPLYAGQRAKVSGNRELYEFGCGYHLAIDRVLDRQFVLQPGDRIRLRFPEKGKKPRRIFSSHVIANINGREVLLRIPALLHGISLENPFSEPEGMIDRVSLPIEDKGYLIHANPP